VRFLAAAIACFFVLVAGCSEDERAGNMTIEIAQSEQPSCRDETATAPAFQCALVSVCEREPGSATCTPVVVTTGGDVSADGGGLLGASALTKITGANGFDMQLQLHGEDDENPVLDATHLEITTVLYAGTDVEGVIVPTHQAIRTGITPAEFLSEPIRIRAYKFGASSCAGPNATGTTADTRRFVERAFHETTRLPNGDVLIYGGIKEGASPTDLNGIGAELQPVIEVYRAQEGRIEKLSGSFARVFFAGSLLTTDPSDDVYRIYVSGGFSASASPMGFDSTQVSGNNYYGSPVVLTAGATAEPDVILSYDRGTGVVTTAPVESEELLGAVAAHDVPGTAMIPVVAGATVAPAPGSSPWTFATPNLWIDRAAAREATGVAGVRSTGNTGRFGHTTTLLGDLNDRAFVWGGNISTASSADVTNLAGQLFASSGTAMTVNAPGDMVGGTFEPVAFHSATRLGANDVIIIGGMQTACVSGDGCVNKGVTANPSRRPVTRFGINATGIGVSTEIPACSYEPTIFHSAIPMDDTALLLTGGSTCSIGAGSTGTACRPGTLFQESASILQVTLSGAGNAPNDALPDSLLQGRFAHQVTPLNTCPAGATDCDDPRYLVTGGMHRVQSGTTVTLEALAHGEVIFAKRAADWGPLNVDENCVLQTPDGGIDSGTPDSGTFDSSCIVDSGTPPVMDSATDAATDAAMDAPTG